MIRAVWFAIVGGIIGLAVGYWFFGEIAGQRVAVDTLVRFTRADGVEGAARELVGRAVGLDDIRRNILVTGIVGAGVAALTSVIAGGSRRR